MCVTPLTVNVLIIFITDIPSFQENLNHLYFSVSGLNLLKIVYLDPSNIIWICYTAYHELETSHIGSIDTKLLSLRPIVCQNTRFLSVRPKLSII